MKSTYILRIWCQFENLEKVSEILGVNWSKENSKCWELILVEKDSDAYVDFINQFLNLLENKYNKLLELGIKRDDITIWKLYEYDGQCNMEFTAEEMKRLGENGINLCVSCWESLDE